MLVLFNWLQPPRGAAGSPVFVRLFAVLLALASLAWICGGGVGDMHAQDAERGDEDTGDGGGGDPLAEYFRENDVYQGNDVAERLTRGSDAFRRGDFEAAHRNYRAAVALSDKHVFAMHMLGLAHFAQGDFEGAARNWRRVLSLFPGWARLELGPLSPDRVFGDHFEVFDDRSDEVAEIVAQAEENDAEAASALDARFVLGYVLFYEGEYGAALRLFHDVLEQDSTDRAAQVFVDVLEAAGLSPTDGESVPEAFELPAHKRWLLPGLYQLGQRRFAEAALAFGEAGMRYSHGEPFAWMAVALIGDEKPDHAARMLTRAIELRRTDLAEMPRARELLGEEVLEARRETWSQAPVPAPRRLLLGLLAFLEGELGEARDHLEPLARLRDGTGDAARALLRMIPEREMPPPVLDVVRLAEQLSEEAIDELVRGGDDDEVPPQASRNDGDDDPDDETSDTPLSFDEVTERIREKHQLGDVALNREDYQRALELYTQAYELGKRFDPNFYDNPMRVDVFLKLSRAYFGLGEYDDATRFLQRFLIGSPEAVRRQVGGYPAPFEEEPLEQALRRLQRTVRNDPDRAAPRFLLGYILFTQGRYPQAYAQLALLNPDGPDAHPLARFYVELLEAPPYEAHLEDQEETAARLLEQGRELLAEQEFTQAEPMLRRAYEIAPGEEVVTALLVTRWGMSLEVEGNEVEALDTRVATFRDMAQTLRNFLREHDEDTWAELSLDFVEAFGNAVLYERARELLETHVRQRPLEFEAQYVLAFVRYFAGEYLEAVENFEKYRDAQRQGEPGAEFEWFRNSAAARQRSGQ